MKIVKKKNKVSPLYIRVQGRPGNGQKILKGNCAHRLTLGIRSGGDESPPTGFGFARSVASLVPTQNLTHIWAVSISPPKRRIPSTLYDILAGIKGQIL